MILAMKYIGTLISRFKKLIRNSMLFFSVLFSILFSINSNAEVVEYELNVTSGEFESDGVLFKNRVLVNGSIPAPELTFRNGDTARITVNNKLSHPTLIHWHGLLIKNDQDGVPFVNSMPIEPKSKKIYEFKIRQTGTYWYHSHVMFQEQDGVYGAFRILPRKVDAKESLPETTVILSDMSKESGKTIHRNLKKDGEYYDLKKDTVQSWFKAFKTGAAGVKFRNSMQRMGGMDYADIAYDMFAANGKNSLEVFSDINSNKKVKIRIINGSASSIFKLTFAGKKMTIVSADGLPVAPVSVKVLPISVAETYDILVDLDSAHKLELRATSFDNSGFASIWLGSGTKKIEAPEMSHTNPIDVTMGEMMGMPKAGFWTEFFMTYKNEFKDIPKDIKYSTEKDYSLPSMDILMPMMADKSQHKMHSMKKMKSSSDNEMKSSGNDFRIMNQTKETIKNNIIEDGLYNELTYGLLKTEDPINTNEKRALRTIPFTLNGNMENYVWSINGRPLGPKTYIKIKKGERVRFEMKNTTMMNHPMHLHGHFFRVMTNQGKHSVLKHTVNVAPLSTTVIEFEANEEKDWFFHCHILYHMMDGMTRIVRYEDNPGPKDLELARVKSKEFNYTDKLFLSSKLLVQSNYSRLEGKVFNSYYMLEYDVLGNYDEDLEGEIHLSRTLTRFMSVYLGGKTEGKQGQYETSPTLGLTWILPFRIGVDLKYQPTLDKKFEIEFSNEIQLTDKLQFNFEYSSIRRFYTELEYRQNKNLSFAVNYNQTYDTWGGGLGLTY
jgi:CopA family copper-resistance protein